MSFKKKETRKPKQNSGIKQNTKLFGNFMRNHFGSQQITSKNKHLKLPLTLNPLFLGDLVGHVFL
jgi:hypothetical protein